MLIFKPNTALCFTFIWKNCHQEKLFISFQNGLRIFVQMKGKKVFFLLLAFVYCFKSWRKNNRKKEPHFHSQVKYFDRPIVFRFHCSFEQKNWRKKAIFCRNSGINRWLKWNCAKEGEYIWLVSENVHENVPLLLTVSHLLFLIYSNQLLPSIHCTRGYLSGVFCCFINSSKYTHTHIQPCMHE